MATRKSRNGSLLPRWGVRTSRPHGLAWAGLQPGARPRSADRTHRARRPSACSDHPVDVFAL